MIKLKKTDALYQQIATYFEREIVEGRLKAGDRIVAKNTRNGERYELTHELSERQVRMVIEGGLLNMMRQELAA